MRRKELTLFGSNDLDFYLFAQPHSVADDFAGFIIHSDLGADY